MSYEGISADNTDENELAKFFKAVGEMTEEQFQRFLEWIDMIHKNND